MAGFLLYLGESGRRLARSGRLRESDNPDAELVADADSFVLLGDYDPYVDYAWNGARLADLARQVDALLVSRTHHAERQVLARTKRRELQPWHAPIVEAATAADRIARFARDLQALVARAMDEGGMLVYSCD
jgi:hypothetical protein